MAWAFAVGYVTWVGTILVAGENPPSSQPTTAAVVGLPNVKRGLAERVIPGPQRFGSGLAKEGFVAGYVAAQRALLAENLKPGGAVTEQVTLRMVAANWELGAAAATPVSRMLLGIDSSEDAQLLGRLTREARDHLKGLESLIAEAKFPEDKAGEITGTRMVLDAFCRTLAFMAEPGAVKDASRVKSALTSAALLLEDDRPAVRAAAELYQAYVLASTGQTDRALTVLGMVLASPASEGAEFALAGKLLRLRILTHYGQPVAAWSLALRGEEQSAKWVDDKLEAMLLRNGFILGRLEALSQIQSAAAARNDGETRAWCAEQRGALEQETFPAERVVPVFRLDGAIPLLMQPPERPSILSIFELPTAAPSIVFVADLSSGVSDGQRREMYRQIAAGCEKMGEKQRFCVVTAARDGARRFPEAGLEKAGETNCRRLGEWLSLQAAEEGADAGAVIEAAGQLKPVQLILVTDRPSDDRWPAALVRCAGPMGSHVDLIHVRPAPEESAKSRVISAGGRYRQIRPSASAAESRPVTGSAPSDVSEPTAETKPIVPGAGEPIGDGDRDRHE